MLQDLHIENIAVIEKADICFTDGLNVLTGETGAGKSIIIDSLQAINGARTNRNMVRSGAEKATATAVFITDKADKWLSENELDTEDELVIKRRITENGKSSCRVCGEPVSAAQLRDLSALLIDIHGQNDGRQLLDESRHREYLDNFGNYGEVIHKYKEEYKKYNDIIKEIQKIETDNAEKEHLTDILRFTIDELESANLREGEEQELSERLELLRNSEKLTEALDSAYGALYSDEYSAISLAEIAQSEAERASRYAEQLKNSVSNISDAVFQLKDSAETLRDFADSLDFSPEEYDSLEMRNSQLTKLFKKYSKGEAELIIKLEDSKKRLEDIEYSDVKLEELTNKLNSQRETINKIANELTDLRRKTADTLQLRIVDELSQLSMPSVTFKVDIKPISNNDGFDATGADQIKFLMSANRGEKPGPINKIASGGELSRIMLALKNVFSERDGTETMVFDEIDTGVSGVAAQRVAEKLAQLSREKQVLCVTHLPQIAAMADTHFHIQKSEKNGRTYTCVEKLCRDGRKLELARLNGGDNITENTLVSADEQLTAAELFKNSL